MPPFALPSLRTLLLCAALLLSALANAAPDPALLQRLASEDTDEKLAAIQLIAEQATPDAIATLQQLAEGNLPGPDGEAIMVNNRVRGAIGSALAALKLFDPELKVRRAAAKEVAASVDATMLPMLEKAIAGESDAAIKALLVEARALAQLGSTDTATRLAAVQALATSGNPNTAALLKNQSDKANEPEVEVRMAAFQSYLTVRDRLRKAEFVSRVFSGISLASILLLAALGLAITYGVMGVINMAHGELLMVGAYATYVVQSLFRAWLPDYVDWYVAAAIPVAFFAAAGVGVLLERTVIRWLYGRPLETLLATWGLSLVLIQAARVLFGAQNVELSNPVWMTGSVELAAGIELPLNRIAIIGFSFFVLALIWVLMNRTRLGLFVRAVTQNRGMAGCVGVPTGRIDSVAFGLGAGIAGLGGVALSQIANVGPDMGQGYIVDSFMVVVLGGVGQLAGAVWAALGLGVATKFIEAGAGAVIAKIVVLIFIIVFIQKRPQGLFALKGRFVES